MSNLLSRIRGEIRQAMLDKDEVKKSILRVVVGEVERKFGSNSDEDVHKAIKRIIEGNNESLKHGANPTLLKEISILDEYLPKLLSLEMIEAALLGTSTDVAIKAAKNDGAAVGAAMKALKTIGAAVDGNDVKTVVKKIRGN